MESAPLTQAYDHAQAASIATHASDHPAAITAHTAAATSFVNAASTTTSPEALRTLALLATHHTTLSNLLVAPNPPPTITDADISADAEAPISTSAAVAELRAKSSSTPPTAQQSSSRRTPANTSLPPPRRMPPRELSSSIASNLASARGIRTAHPLSPGLTTTNAPGAITARRRTQDTTTPSPGPSWLPPVTHDQLASPSRPANPPADITLPASETDDGFTRFYSTFEGLLSKLSAPLAFAGLPLIAEEPAAQPAKPPSRPSTSASAAPDLSKYISRAALRASASNPGAAADSFYVVPATGGTASYASILSFAEKEKRRLADLRPASSFDDDDFVDAREHPSPPSPTKSRSFAAASGSRSGSKSAKEVEREREELGIENKSLKACVDMLSKRLHAFEAAAQSSTIALHESMRFLRPVSPGASGAGAGTPMGLEVVKGDAPTGNDVRILTARAEGLEARLVAVEAQLGDEKRARRVAEAENEKLRGVVGRYRERWERLKEGAKNRRDGNGKDGKDGKEGGGNGEGKQGVDGPRFVAG
ncbi:hypothetical protein V497_06547 [Pseudogymnoascus sp. VKM F-4516 (FW-969)]|nr:hypothetical protein V497_06547 [Pseudogymnoascus sp. VKM F-4516 (FW-969)]